MAETLQKQEGPRESDRAAKGQAEAHPVRETPKAAKVEADKKLETEQKAEKKAEEKKPAPRKREEKKPAEKKRDVVLERVYAFNLRDAYAKPRTKRTRAAARILRELLARHLKTDPGLVRLAPALDAWMRARGIGRPEKRVKVRASKDREGLVLAELTAEEKRAAPASKAAPKTPAAAQAPAA
jgi:large subunit ribosomal protein L31e